MIIEIDGTQAGETNDYLNPLGLIDPQLTIEIDDSVAAETNVNDVGARLDALEAYEPPFPRGHIFGLETSLELDSDHEIKVWPGECRSYCNQYNLILQNHLFKHIDASWAIGGGGGLFYGTVAANTTYHLFLIRRDADGSIDAGWDTDIDCANIPSGYTAYRRIASFVTDSSANILQTSQLADEFRLKEWVCDLAGTSLTSTATNVSISVPSGVQVLAMIEPRCSESTGVLTYWYSPDDDDQSVVYGIGTNPATVKNEATANSLYVRTNTTGQIRVIASSSTTSHYLYTRGWVDHRGQYGGK